MAIAEYAIRYTITSVQSSVFTPNTAASTYSLSEATPVYLKPRWAPL